MALTRRDLFFGLLSSACVTVFAGGLALHAAAAADLTEFPVSQLSIETARGRFAFVVELADTGARRTQGLQGRRTLAPNAGMLFDFRIPQFVSMWMKDTYLSLDMIFVAANGIILNVAHGTVPHSLIPVSSAGEVLGVIEVNAGTAARLGIGPGDRVSHPIFDGGGD